MKRLQRAAVLSDLIQQMRAHDSWCGETHVQKATYFLQDLLGVDLGYDFVVYKHGPFSFDLRDELGEFVWDKLIRYEPQVPPYGPRITVTPDAAKLRETHPTTLARNEAKIRFVAEKLDARGVVDLERLATALYVTLDRPNAEVEARAHALRLLKPHIPEPAAVGAVSEVDQIRAEAQALAA
jgi:catechol 2,3-dioxygenase-like lactoylglutathione lyase family enzyme